MSRYLHCGQCDQCQKDRELCQTSVLESRWEKKLNVAIWVPESMLSTLANYLWTHKPLDSEIGLSLLPELLGLSRISMSFGWASSNLKIQNSSFFVVLLDECHKFPWTLFDVVGEEMLFLYPLTFSLWDLQFKLINGSFTEENLYRFYWYK